MESQAVCSVGLNARGQLEESGDRRNSNISIIEICVCLSASSVPQCIWLKASFVCLVCD